MSLPLPRGACPALSAPMQTGDGLLVRLSPASGFFTPAALMGLAEAAFRHGNSILEVTGRGSLQIRGLEAATVAPLAADIDALGIVVREGVPVETGPLAGLDPHETADPRPLVEAIGRAIAAVDLAKRLGPKVSVVVDGGGRLNMAGIQADVRLAAARSGQHVDWQFSVGGNAATAAPIALLDEAHACDAAITALNAIAEKGIRARGRHLAPAILRAELARAVSDAASPDLAGEQEASGEDNIVVLHPRGVAQSALPVGVFELADGRAALGVGLPFGQIEASRLTGFCCEAEAAGVEEFRLAPGRALLAIAPGAGVCADLSDIAPRHGFIGDPGDPRLCIAACPGSPACGSGQVAARIVAEQLAALGTGLFDNSLSLHVSGCGKGCAHPAAADLTFVGLPDGIGLVIGGKAQDVAEVRLPNAEIRHGFQRLAGLYRETRRPGESARTCFSRLGAQRVAAAFQGNS
jgi:precorrin-3B synthase